MMQLVYFTISVLIVALLAAFVILLITKLGLREKVIVRGNDFFSEMFSCDFCLSFWCGLFFSLAFTIASGSFLFFLVPFLSTPITRRLL